MRTALNIFICVALAAVASTPVTAGPKSPKLARCDGKARRPANVNGSILPSVDPAAGTVTSASPDPSGIDVFPRANPPGPRPRGSTPEPPAGGTPPTPVPPIGAIDPAPQFRSC